MTVGCRFQVVLAQLACAATAHCDKARGCEATGMYMKQACRPYGSRPYVALSVPPTVPQNIFNKCTCILLQHQVVLILAQLGLRQDSSTGAGCSTDTLTHGHVSTTGAFSNATQDMFRCTSTAPLQTAVAAMAAIGGCQNATLVAPAGTLMHAQASKTAAHA